MELLREALDMVLIAPYGQAGAVEAGRKLVIAGLPGVRKPAEAVDLQFKIDAGDEG